MFPRSNITSLRSLSLVVLGLHGFSMVGQQNTNVGVASEDGVVVGTVVPSVRTPLPLGVQLPVHAAGHAEILDHLVEGGDVLDTTVVAGEPFWADFASDFLKNDWFANLFANGCVSRDPGASVVSVEGVKVGSKLGTRNGLVVLNPLVVVVDP